MSKKIVFIVNNIGDSHCHHRIMQYLSSGYEVEVFGFERPNSVWLDNLSYTINSLGFITSGKYFNRTKVYYRGFRRVLQGHSKDDTVYFLFGLDMACYFRMFCPGWKYIYEEADLVYTYLPKPVTFLLKAIDKRIIRHAEKTIFTSEGFLRFHYGHDVPSNVEVIPNKLSREILLYPNQPKTEHGSGLRFAFVGYARFDSLDRFIETFLRNFPEHEFHFYGTTEQRMQRFANEYKNVFYHGRFRNPVDLPSIYKDVDVLVCTYDYRYDNVRYAEPNKLYEAIYFKTPIIVSNNTFLFERVEQMGIGYGVNPFDDKDVIRLVGTILPDSIHKKIENIKTIDTSIAVMTLN